jgi:hypothetical protein
MSENCPRPVAVEHRTTDGDIEFIEDKPVRGISMSRYTQPIQDDPVEVTLLENLRT